MKKYCIYLLLFVTQGFIISGCMWPMNPSKRGVQISVRKNNPSVIVDDRYEKDIMPNGCVIYELMDSSLNEYVLIKNSEGKIRKINLPNDADLAVYGGRSISLYFLNEKGLIDTDFNRFFSSVKENSN